MEQGSDSMLAPSLPKIWREELLIVEDDPDSSLLLFPILDQWQAQLHREEAGNSLN